MDGTIVNTEPLWIEATRQLLLRRNIFVTSKIQHQINMRVRGLNIYDCMLAIKMMFKLKDDVVTLAREETQLAHDLYETHLAFMDGFEQFHQSLKKFNIKHAIATNASDAGMAQVNKILQLDRFFGTHIYGISAVNGVSKPAPDIFLYAAQQLGSDPFECIVIEDSIHGIKAAKTAGMYCIGIDKTDDSAFTRGADLVVKNFHELDVQILCNDYLAVASLK